MNINSLHNHPVSSTNYWIYPVDNNKNNCVNNDCKYVDPLAKWPLRGLGYTNDIGIAINEIAPTAARLFWVPALLYFGADVYDKYKNKGNKYDPNANRAFSQAIFQAMASIVLPTVSGHVGQSVFAELARFKKAKLSTNAKEQTLRYIMAHAAGHEIFVDGVEKDNAREMFDKRFGIFYDKKQRYYKKNNLFSKTWDFLLANSQKGAIAKSDENLLKTYAKEQFDELLTKCSDMNMLKKVVDKKIFKLKSWKSLGAFTFLLMSVKPIDEFVVNILIKQVVEPQVDKIDFSKVTISNFIKSKELT